MSDNNKPQPIIVNLNEPINAPDAPPSAPSCAWNPVPQSPSKDAQIAIDKIQSDKVEEIKNLIKSQQVEPKHQARKQAPIYSGVLNYFPDALWQVAKCSKQGNDQHNAGEPLHWAREKSTDESDALVRHLMQYDQMDDDGIIHAAKVAWRALALLQRTLEARGEAPLSPYNIES